MRMSVNQVIEDAKKFESNFTGSALTSNMVAKQILNRFGEEALKEYDPKKNCLTYKDWKRIGYIVKKGSKPITSVKVLTKVETDDKGNLIEDEDTKKVMFIKLFWKDQVVPMKH